MAMHPAKKAAIQEARTIAKEHGVKHCKWGTHSIYVGRQTSRLDTESANNILTAFEKAGFYVAQLDTCRALADGGLLDSFAVNKLAA